MSSPSLFKKALLPGLLNTGSPFSFQYSRPHTLQGQAREWDPPPHPMQLVIRNIVVFSSISPLQSFSVHFFNCSICKTLLWDMFLIILYTVYVNLLLNRKSVNKFTLICLKCKFLRCILMGKFEFYQS